jgi:hypothetical protein
LRDYAMLPEPLAKAACWGLSLADMMCVVRIWPL